MPRKRHIEDLVHFDNPEIQEAFAQAARAYRRGKIRIEDLGLS